MALPTSIIKEAYRVTGRTARRWRAARLPVEDPTALMIALQSRPGRLAGAALDLIDADHRSRVARRIQELQRPTPIA